MMSRTHSPAGRLARISVVLALGSGIAVAGAPAHAQASVSAEPLVVGSVDTASLFGATCLAISPECMGSSYYLGSYGLR